MRSPLRLTVSRLGFALLITSLSLIQLLWVLYHKNDGGQGRIDTSKQSYKATAKITINPNPPPIPNDSFPQLRLSEERLTSIHRNSTLPSPSQIPTTHPLLSTSKPSSTQPYILPLHPLANPKFTLPYEVSQPSSRHLSLAMIAINTKKTEQLGQEFQWKLTRTLLSLFRYSSGTPLHMILITDIFTLPALARFLLNFVARHISTSVIQRGKKVFPPLVHTFVDIQQIIAVDQPFFAALKNTSGRSGEAKYAADLFYIGPLYHLAFTNLPRMVVIDSTDLEFFDDIEELFDQFELMSSQAVIAIGRDLSPHYRSLLSNFLKKNPNSVLGKPGPLQGLNTGVVLFNLERMRRSSLLSQYLQPHRAGVLMDKFGYPMMLGDQDWFTNLQFEQPMLVHLLPCRFNAQTDLEYLTQPWLETFFDYHYCDSKSRLALVHRNGCGPLPQFCGNPQRPTQGLTDVYLDTEEVWSTLPILNGTSPQKRLHQLLAKAMYVNCVRHASSTCANFY